jgi:hypothetical protein
MSKWPFKIKYSSFVKRPRQPPCMQPSGWGQKKSKQGFLSRLSSALRVAVLEHFRAARPGVL